MVDEILKLDPHYIRTYLAGCLEKWELGNGGGEWGVSNEEEVTGVSISLLLKVFNQHESCTVILEEKSCLYVKKLG